MEDEKHKLRYLVEYKGGATAFCKCGKDWNAANKEEAAHKWAEHYRTETMRGKPSEKE
jgi:hypothetical protein